MEINEFKALVNPNLKLTPAERKEKYRAYKKKYDEKHREHKRAWSKAYYQKNKERINAYHKAWQKRKKEANQNESNQVPV